MRGIALLLLAAALPLSACEASTPASSGAPSSTPPAATSVPPPTTTSQPTSFPSASEQPCSPTDLTVSLGQQNGAAGHIYIPLLFTNTGPAPCALSGYPGATLAAGTPPTPLGPPAEPARNAKIPTPVSLALTKSARSTLEYTQAGNFDCTRTPSQYLLITTPGSPAPTPLPFTAPACTNPAYPLLHLTPFEPSP